MADRKTETFHKAPDAQQGSGAFHYHQKSPRY
jgi:hypothetical protein